MADVQGWRIHDPHRAAPSRRRWRKGTGAACACVLVAGLTGCGGGAPPDRSADVLDLGGGIQLSLDGAVLVSGPRPPS